MFTIHLFNYHLELSQNTSHNFSNVVWAQRYLWLSKYQAKKQKVLEAETWDRLQAMMVGLGLALHLLQPLWVRSTEQTRRSDFSNIVLYEIVPIRMHNLARFYRAGEKTNRISLSKVVNVIQVHIQKIPTVHQQLSLGRS